MPGPEDELLAYVKQLIEATSSGAMSWTEVNPSTFVWDTKQPRSARLSLQRVTRPVMIQPGRPQYGFRNEYTYLLQALEMQPNAAIVKVSMNGAEMKHLNESLDALYKLIEAKKARDSIDFLKSIIPRTPDA